MKITNTNSANLARLTTLSKETKAAKEEKPQETLKREDTFERQKTVSDSVTYSPPKKLTEEQVSEINTQRKEATLKMVEDAVRQGVETQAKQTGIFHNGFEIDTEFANALTEIFGSLEAALPTPATTPEGALADISEGGAYSVEAVSERIMAMATAIAGDDLYLLGEMRYAVTKGFEAAGFDIETGGDMPDITMDTYNHVMAEFDKLESPPEVEAEDLESTDTK